MLDKEDMRVLIIALLMSIAMTSSVDATKHHHRHVPEFYHSREDTYPHQCGIASIYSTHEAEGSRTASGIRLRNDRLTVAHRYRKLRSWVRVTNTENRRQAVAEVTDRGPFVFSRMLDMTLGLARILGIGQRQGLGHVCVDSVF